VEGCERVASGSVTGGIVGSALGIISSVAGFLWVLAFIAFNDAYNSAVALQFLVFDQAHLTWVMHQSFFMNIYVYEVLDGFIGATFILSILLAVTIILVGVGLYGLGKATDTETAGTVALVSGVISGILAPILLLIGAAAGENTLTPLSIAILRFLLIEPGILEEAPVGLIVLAGGVPAVNQPALWLGLVVVGLTIILFGVVFIKLREGLPSPSLSVAIGVLSIIAGIAYMVYVPGSIIGFIMLFIISILEIVLFAQSRELT